MDLTTEILTGFVVGFVVRFCFNISYLGKKCAKIKLNLKSHHSILAFNSTLPKWSSLSELNEEDNNIDLLGKGSMKIKFW